MLQKHADIKALAFWSILYGILPVEFWLLRFHDSDGEVYEDTSRLYFNEEWTQNREFWDGRYIMSESQHKDLLHIFHMWELGRCFDWFKKVFANSNKNWDAENYQRGAIRTRFGIGRSKQWNLLYKVQSRW